MNLSIIGDSFSYNSELSWVELLSDIHNIDCLSQPGCSEYKVYQQSKHISKQWTDVVIVSHTNWTRIPVKEHPVHTAGMHQNCDLIFADCLDHSIMSATNFFEQHFWDNFWKDTYKLYREKISHELHDFFVLHLDFFDHNLGNEHYKHDMTTYPLTFPGNICHMSKEGNEKVFKIVSNLLGSLNENGG